jgi:hypothetical protein
MSVISP